MANSNSSETFPAETVSSDMVPTYHFASFCHINRYETHLNLKHFISSDMIAYNRGFLKLLYGCNFFSALHCIFFFLLILWQHSLCVFVSQFEIFYPQSLGIHRNFCPFSLVVGLNYQKYKLFLLFIKKSLF